MIKFFHHIRRSLINQNQMGKYFKYAIGEILLVVIGILIALQINNWNENNKLEAKTQDYYKQLLIDLNKDKVFAKNTIAKFQQQREDYNNYLKNFNKQNYTTSEMYNDLVALNLESFAINFNTNTIESLQNSGEIVLIPTHIRNALMNLKRKQEKISQDESLDNRGKTGITERLSLLIGSLNLKDRLENHENIKADLNLEKNKGQIILGLEAIQDWMRFSETKSIRLLNEMLKEIGTVEEQIQKEIK
ncbi:DUF6090 family protein [Winogradskyella vincentii]|uniref:Uncharacterized protein n=1 Tax=Winogradskyella vincentii TaxID=2877122 RepID=A0ABS7Y497_9FLAO|nr:DUF6090 family protein [Winogradskyella vincentii]MCA0154416.1 hypothetical protein [Winogradskyella vincentii]